MSIRSGKVRIDTIAFFYLRAVVLAGPANVHDAGGITAVGVSLSGVRLFFESRLLNAARSASRIVFHAVAVPVNSLQPDSQVWIIAGVGGMSMPFCESGPSTV